jgi:hypothetical protein
MSTNSVHLTHLELEFLARIISEDPGNIEQLAEFQRIIGIAATGANQPI